MRGDLLSMQAAGLDEDFVGVPACCDAARDVEARDIRFHGVGIVLGFTTRRIDADSHGLR